MLSWLEKHGFCKAVQAENWQDSWIRYPVKPGMTLQGTKYRKCVRKGQNSDLRLSSRWCSPGYLPFSALRKKEVWRKISPIGFPATEKTWQRTQEIFTMPRTFAGMLTTTLHSSWTLHNPITGKIHPGHPESLPGNHPQDAISTTHIFTNRSRNWRLHISDLFRRLSGFFLRWLSTAGLITFCFRFLRFRYPVL